MAPSGPCTSQEPRDLFPPFKSNLPSPGSFQRHSPSPVHFQPLLALPAAQLDAVLSPTLGSQTPCLTPTRHTGLPGFPASPVEMVAVSLLPVQGSLPLTPTFPSPVPLPRASPERRCSSSARTSAACSGSPGGVTGAQAPALGWLFPGGEPWDGGEGMGPAWRKETTAETEAIRAGGGSLAWRRLSSTPALPGQDHSHADPGNEQERLS